LKDQLKKHL